MAEYGFSVDQVLELTVKRFWFISNMIDRIRAEKDLRQIQLMASVGSKEAYEAAFKSLNSQAGEVFVLEKEIPTEIRIDPKTGLDPEFDREGLRALKMKIAAGR
jgi:hypothetical protein